MENNWYYLAYLPGGYPERPYDDYRSHECDWPEANSNSYLYVYQTLEEAAWKLLELNIQWIS